MIDRMRDRVLDRNDLAERYRRVRAQTEAIAAPLTVEDMLVQSMPDASPTKWHLAHTTWFFEEFVLARYVASHRWEDEAWRVLFNSYYGSVGPSHPRAARSALSRPSLAEVRAWRLRVDAQVESLLVHAEPAVLEVVLLGTHHEQQHQELMLTDVKHAFFQNLLRPAYAPSRDLTSAPADAGAPRSDAAGPSPPRSSPEWVAYEEQSAPIGYEGDGFAFDNERPLHRALVGPFRLASRPVTNREYARFIADGGYERPDLWLSDGFSKRAEQGWIAPLYWAGESAFTLHGVETCDLEAPVAHLSFYEADAYARWAGARLPTEQEWEVAAREEALTGNFLESGRLSPAAVPAAVPGPRRRGPTQLFGDVWEWTASAYLPYPRFRALAGSLGEYNGKFMSGQMVLRGGSCLSPQSHLRATYRNYFPPQTRWQMTGLRLARDDA